MDYKKAYEQEVKQKVMQDSANQDRIRELEAHCEALRQELYVFKNYCDCGHPSCSRCKDVYSINKVLEETPAQSLAPIQREAIETARDAFVEAVRAKETSSAYHFFSKYAEQLTDNA